MRTQIMDIYNSLQEIAWQFGSHGVNGECCEDLSFIEFMALKKIRENDKISVQELGSLLNITKSGSTKIVNRLEQKGYVIRKTSHSDGRVCCVCTTERGISVLTRIIGRYTVYIEKMLSDLNSEQVQGIDFVLKLLVKTANENSVAENLGKE